MTEFTDAILADADFSLCLLVRMQLSYFWSQIGIFAFRVLGDALRLHTGVTSFLLMFKCLYKVKQFQHMLSDVRT